jgi:hypothetical protein
MTDRSVDLVVTDLDGTLWDHREWVHPDTVAALARLAAAGVPVLAATARRPATALAGMQGNGILLPAVLFDGSLGRDLTDGTVFHHRVFDTTDASAVLEAFLECGLEPCVNIDHPSHDFLIGDNPSTHPGLLEFNATRTVRADLHEATGSVAIFSFVLAGMKREEILPMLEATEGFAEATVMRGMFGGATLSVRPLGVSKWNGVVAFCAARGLDLTRVLAVGDGENDLELLSAASIACVPEDGCEAALELADHRIPPAHDGGWAAVLDFVA